MTFSSRNLKKIAKIIATLLLLFIALGGIAAWWFAPDINRMRPQIESLLKQELQLSELNLQGLSWYWAGYIGFKVAHCSFKTKDKMITVDDTSLTIQVSLMGLFHGELLPKRIALHGGLLQLDASNYSHKKNLNILPTHLIMDDMDVQWRYASYQGKLKSAALDINLPSGSALLRMPGFRLTATLDPKSQLISADWKFDNIHWLPAQWQKFILGDVSGEAHLQQKNKLQWQLDMRTQGSAAAINLPTGPFQLPFDQLLSTWLISFDKDYNLQQWNIPSLTWLQGKNQGTGNIHWQDGELSLHAVSAHLEMPLLWSWLRPLDNSKDWLNWLSKMSSGVASDIQVSLNLPWQQPLQGLPENKDWDKLRYHINAKINDLDIYLGPDDNRLIHGRAKIDVNEHGLQANISHVELPHDAGTVSGTLDMPWQSLDMNIRAHGQTDLGKLQQWLKLSQPEYLHWTHAPAATSIQLQWNPLKEKASLIHVSLKPSAIWDFESNQIPLQIKSGEIIWDMQQGLSAKELNIQGKLLHGNISFQAKRTAQGTLQLTHLTSQIQGDFSDLIAHYHIPIEQPSGQLQANITFDNNWHGTLNFGHASWKNFLGSNKPIGSPMQVSFQGDFENGNLKLHKLFCDQAPIQLLGSGQINKYGLKLDLTSLKAPAFEGALKVSAPFTKEPWEMMINAQYLNRKALPEQLPQADSLADKHWSLQANIDKFIWDDATMTGVSMKLASKRNSVGIFKAHEIHSGTILLQDISALFALPGNSAVDLRQLSASMGKQHLMLSASLTPEPTGGMRWQGFAQLEGNFGETMRWAKLTKLFAGGDMQALFLGQGILLKNQPWWEGLRGRLRLRVDNGIILKGGTLTKTLAAVSLVDLPDLFFGNRKDLNKKGLYYKRLQIEASLQDQMFNIHNLGLRSSAVDIAGKGNLNLEKNNIDLTMIVRPFQNLDALLGKIPLLRDLLGGAAHSLIRKIYHMHGPLSNATVDQVSPEEAGLSS
ncbi:MAG: AsmA-like C-terminal domain-containing protein, partial [Mariprofundaceae bacterium]|nr:AsmA-like C-terminal domain-containing protein [Mariprofundaceae bacterium]